MLSSLRSYWDRLRAGRVAPYRAEIDPRQFEPALENMFIIEKLAPDNMRIRLAGMKICEMMGMEVRGMQPAYLIDEADRARFDRLLNVVMGEPAVVEKAAWEFADTEKMVQVAERLYGPYRWERYDIIVLPPSFPFGGMENPRLTFATPTVIAGDRSLMALVAHAQAQWERVAWLLGAAEGLQEAVGVPLPLYTAARRADAAAAARRALGAEAFASAFAEGYSVMDLEHAVRFALEEDAIRIIDGTGP